MELAGSFLSPLLERLFRLVEEPLVGALNVKKDLEDIMKNLERIDCVLENTEKRALRDKSVRLWMRELRDVKYEMEDLIDDYEYERDRLANAPFYKKFKISLVKTRVAKRIKDIQAKLDHIEKRNDVFPLVKKVSERYQVDKKDLDVHMNIFGMKIEESTKELIKLITKVGEKEDRNSIIAITGIGGVGKTTLAHNVYSQLKGMGKSFDIISWIDVTNNFDYRTLLQEILKRINPDDCKDIDSSLAPSIILEDLLKHDNIPKKFFLVLDDIWKGDIFDKFLYGCLRYGAIGSKILITSRDDNIAMQMQASRIFKVDVLEESDALSLLYQSVFYNETKEEIEQDKQLLNDIAIRIVKKCDCLPLAIKVIGGVLRTKEKRENEWKKVLNSDLWMLDDFKYSVMASLHLSYIDINSSYRECFMYLSLFPNKYIFVKSSIVPFWIAEGLVEEDQGEECFESLVRRNLLQESIDLVGGYVLHDLVYSFVRKLTEGEHVFEEGDRLKNLNGHRYSISNSKIPFGKTFKYNKNLRSLMLFNCSQVTHMPGKDVIKKLRHLRVLYLKGTGIKALPDYVTKLMQLRLLDLSGTNIKLLPESMGRLSNLEHLNLEKCMELDSLPESLTKLKNLRILDTDLNTIKYVPKGLDSLTKLEGLYCYAEIQELGPLINLKYLSIQGVEGIDVVEAEKAKLNEKSKLRDLYITFRPYNENVDKNRNAEMQEKVLEALCPPPCLEMLFFRGFSGTRMPSWLSSSSDTLRNLIDLELKDIERCQQLPELGQLPNLQHLTILSAHCVESIGLEFFYIDGRWQNGSQPFRKLKVLKLVNMTALENCQWTMDASASDNKKKEETTAMPFPRLEELYVTECPALVSLWGCLHAATALTKLVIVDCYCLEVVPELPAVKELIVENCRRIKKAGPFPLLETVIYEDKLPMERLPIWLGRIRSGEAPPAPSLQQLYMEIGDNYLIRRLYPYEIGLDWPLIQNIPTVYVIVKDGPHRGDFFGYRKSPFLCEANILNEYDCSEKADAPRKCCPIDFTAYSDGIKQRPDSKDTKQDDTRHASQPREVVPATRRDLIDLANGVSTKPVRWDGFYVHPIELPFNFHSHLEVITCDGKKQVLCIDQPYSSFETGFVTTAGEEIHAHLPHTTTRESSMACFSTRHSLGNIYDTVNGLHGMTKLPFFKNSKSLRIESLEGLKLHDAKAASLKQKVNLQSLYMCCTSLTDYYNPSERQDIKTQEQILEALCPPPSIRKLSFGFSYGPQLPSWLSLSYHGCLPNLMVLQLTHLPCIQLLQLGELPNLQCLEISAPTCRRSLGLEFVDIKGGQQIRTQHFCKLKFLKMENLNKMEECQWMNSLATCCSMDKEGSLTLWPEPENRHETCPKLIFLHGCLHVTRLLASLELANCFQLQMIPELPAVKLLIIHNCLSIIQAGPFPCLEKVFWKETQGTIKILPKWLGGLSSGNAPSAPLLQLLNMEIGDSHLIRRLNRCDIGFDWPAIKNIPIVEVNVKYRYSYDDYFYYKKMPFLIERTTGLLLYTETNSVFHSRPMDFATSFRRSLLASDGPVGIEGVHAVPDDLVSNKDVPNSIEWNVDDKESEDDPTQPPEWREGQAETQKDGDSILQDNETTTSAVGERQLVRIDQKCSTDQAEFQNPNDDGATPPRETVPGTGSHLYKKLEGVLPPWDDPSVQFYVSIGELPFNFHSHVEVITVDGERKILCIDQSHSAQTGFAYEFPDHYHLPYATAKGESGVACFSHRFDIVMKWPSSRRRGSAEQLPCNPDV